MQICIDCFQKPCCDVSISGLAEPKVRETDFFTLLNTFRTSKKHRVFFGFLLLRRKKVLLALLRRHEKDAKTIVLHCKNQCFDVQDNTSCSPKHIK